MKNAHNTGKLIVSKSTVATFQSSNIKAAYTSIINSHIDAHQYTSIINSHID